MRPIIILMTWATMMISGCDIAHELTPSSSEEGIKTAQEFSDFLNAVTLGGDLNPYLNEQGEVSLGADIDMSQIAWNGGGGSAVSVNTTTPNQKVTYTLGGHTFSGVFNGNGHRIFNLDIHHHLEDNKMAYGLFTALDSTAIVKNLTLSGKVTVTGKAPQGAAIGGLVGYCKGKLIACVNQMELSFQGEDASNISVRLGGLAGVLDNGQLGGTSSNEEGCRNEGDLTCQVIANKGNGAYSAFHQGGVVGYVEGAHAIVGYALNQGAISAPSGRGGGIAGTLTEGRIVNCTNEGTIQDDIEGIFAGLSNRYDVKRLGGILGGSAANTYVTDCVNTGNVFSQNGSRTGGFVGHNGGYVQNCTNTGIILADITTAGTAKHGPGWACGYSGTSSTEYFITGCHMGGKVGTYSEFKEHPDQAPAANYSNAVRHGAFDPAQNSLSNQDEAYYDWTLTDSVQLASGVIYRSYSFMNFGQHIYTVEVDLNNPNVTFETAMADEISPNPNANNNANNGKNLRETLSETCLRRRQEGRNIIAGINTGFFNSNDGFPRGMHIEEGEPVFVNNPDVRNRLVNHRPGFTFFENRQISFGNREFSGMVKVGGQEFEFYSINDTIVRLNGSSTYDANVYTARYVKNPHAGIPNPIGAHALFVVARLSDAGVRVNQGYQQATITKIVDGRNSSVEVPYVSDSKEWVLQVTGNKADQLAGLLSVDAPIEINTKLTIGNTTENIKVHNSSMYRYVQNGQYVAPSSEDAANTIDPTTNLGLKNNGHTVVLFCVDGRTEADRGLNFYEASRVAIKLGLQDVIRFDGGGSTTMWTYKNGTGSVVNHPSDSRGERSCMNYLHIRISE